MDNIYQTTYTFDKCNIEKQACVVLKLVVRNDYINPTHILKNASRSTKTKLKSLHVL